MIAWIVTEPLKRDTEIFVAKVKTCLERIVECPQFWRDGRVYTVNCLMLKKRENEQTFFVTYDCWGDSRRLLRFLDQDLKSLCLVVLL